MMHETENLNKYFLDIFSYFYCVFLHYSHAKPHTQYGFTETSCLDFSRSRVKLVIMIEPLHNYLFLHFF